MYLRFTSPVRSGRRGVHMGIFQAAFICRDDVDMPAYLHKQLIEEIDWFKANLQSPNARHFRTQHFSQFRCESICWFKSSAKQMIDHAWALRALLEECGMPISLLHTKNPGHISFEDNYQIVAYPRRDAAIKFS